MRHIDPEEGHDPHKKYDVTVVDPDGVTNIGRCLDSPARSLLIRLAKERFQWVHGYWPSDDAEITIVESEHQA